MRFNNLDDWLAWQETLHPQEIELGLDRVSQVFQKLHSDKPSFLTITVAGTNGKGSCVAMLESILQSAGVRTCAYTSPHLLKYNERIHVNGQEITDTDLCAAFERVDTAREDTSLTYFEFGTLAALDVFYRDKPDVVILEVGLGGRLDAVNIIDADIALITPIDIDHSEWLGSSREKIAYEKAGVIRHRKQVVCVETKPPASLLNTARDLDASVFIAGRDFHWEKNNNHWQWHTSQSARKKLVLPAIAGDAQLSNAAAVLMVLECLAERYPVTDAAMNQGLSRLQLAGRFQQVGGEVRYIFDVAHNPHAAQTLYTNLQATPATGNTWAVVGMLADKDIAGTLSPLIPVIDGWYVVGIDAVRGSTPDQLVQILSTMSQDTHIKTCDSVSAALQAARGGAEPGDRIVIFGSFYVVAEAMQHVI